MQNKQIHIRENSWMARIAARKLGASAVALTLGNTIHLHRTCKSSFLLDEKWVKHELKHVEQFRRYGYISFILLYLLESLKKGYYMNRFEVEARGAEAEHLETWVNPPSIPPYRNQSIPSDR